MFLYIIIGVTLILAWPAFSLLFDGLKWIYNRAKGKSNENSSTQSSVTEDMEDEGYSHRASTIDDMHIHNGRIVSSDDPHFL